MDPELLKYTKTLVKLGVVLLVLAIVYLFFTSIVPILGIITQRLPQVFLPFIIAVIMAVLIEPLVNFFETRARMKRAWATAISLLVVVGSFVYLFSLIISTIINELTGLFPQVARYSDTLVGRVMETATHFRWFYLQLNLPPAAQDALQSNLQKGLELLTSLMNSSIDALTQFLFMLPGFIIFVIITAVATYLITNDRSLIRSFVLGVVPGSARSKTSNVVAQLFKALIGFVKAYSILITITAIVTMISLKLLGVKYVLTIGILVGMLDLLPVLGPGSIFIPWSIYEILMQNNRLGISLLVVYGVISGVRQVLEPKILGDNIGLHPLATLMSIYVGLQLVGTAGLVLGPVLLVIIIASARAGLFERFDWRKRA